MTFGPLGLRHLSVLGLVALVACGGSPSSPGECVPSAEVCDGVDNDCDGQVDEDLGDIACGLGACLVLAPACVDGAPGACTPGLAEAESCDGIDNDCDGIVDNGCDCIGNETRPCYSGPPATLGVGQCQGGVQTCIAGAWGGCEGEQLPVAESCNGHDDDCDGQIDDGSPGGGSCSTGLLGVCAAGTIACQGGESVCSQNVLPATEVCDGLDNDCDGVIDGPSAADATTYYRDADADGYGNPSATVRACSAPAGYVTDSSDCNDSNAGVHPDSTWVAHRACSPNETPQPCSVCDGGWVGTRSCQANCQWSTDCFGVTATRTWNGDDPALGHSCGARWPWNIPGYSCVANEWCSDTSNCMLTYGPYVSLPAGTYNVTFSGQYYGKQNFLLYGSWLDFDVYDYDRDVVLASLIDYHVNSDRSQDVQLSVNIPATHQCYRHEFREKFRFGAFNKFDKVTVTRTSGNTYSLPYVCTPGTWRACTLPDGSCGDGRQSCNAEGTGWGLCSDVQGLCAARQGCPISRAQGHRTRLHNGRVPSGGQVCWTREARANELINVTVANAGGGYTIDLKRSDGTLVASRASFKNHVVTVKDNYKVCYRNNDFWGGESSFRLTFDVAAPTCDRAFDFGCFGSRGPNCESHVLPNTGCAGVDENNDMLQLCPTSIGSNRHDSCCAHHPGGEWCGNVGYDGARANDEFASACADPSCTIPLLDYPNFDKAYYFGGYKLCTKEWDMAVHDDGDGHAFLGWYQWYDGTVPFYRPTHIVGQTNRGSSQLPFFDDKGPTAGARLAPGGTRIRLIDAAQGWCLGNDYGPNGTYVAVGGELAECKGPSAPMPQ